MSRCLCGAFNPYQDACSEDRLRAFHARRKQSAIRTTSLPKSSRLRTRARKQHVRESTVLQMTRQPMPLHQDASEETTLRAKIKSIISESKSALETDEDEEEVATILTS